MPPFDHVEKEKWIEDYVERETTGARKRVDDAEAAVQQEQDGMKHTGITGLTNIEPEKTLDNMMITIGDSQSYVVYSDDGEDRYNEDEEQQAPRMVSKDDEPGWVMGTITKNVPQHMQRFRQKQMMRDKVAQLGWEDAANYFRE
jgi:hypothetical protein